MSDPVDHVAKVILERGNPMNIHEATITARAALAAIRDPTEAMCDAAHSDCWWDDMSPLTVWQAMIDEMLK